MKKLLTFSALLKNIRTQSGLTQKEFSDSLGVSKVLIGMLESLLCIETSEGSGFHKF